MTVNLTVPDSASKRPPWEAVPPSVKSEGERPYGEASRYASPAQNTKRYVKK